MVIFISFPTFFSFNTFYCPPCPPRAQNLQRTVKTTNFQIISQAIINSQNHYSHGTVTSSTSVLNSEYSGVEENGAILGGS